jgi:hypothetical protein
LGDDNFPEKITIFVNKIMTVNKRKIQILTDLISSDSDHDDGLSFCLVTLDEAALTKILDTHRRWRGCFPDALEITLEDRDGWTMFLSSDENDILETVFEPQKKTEYKFITDESKFLDFSEEDNDRDAWNLMYRKIIIREEDVRFCAVYEYTPFLRNSFTASQMIPLEEFEKALRALRFQTRRKLDGGFVEYEELGAFYKADNATTLLIVPTLKDGSPEMDGQVMNASPVLFELIFGDDCEKIKQILAELLEYNAALEGEKS